MVIKINQAQNMLTFGKKPLSARGGFFVEINRKNVYIDKKSRENEKKSQNSEEKWQN